VSLIFIGFSSFYFALERFFQIPKRKSISAYRCRNFPKSALAGE
jgi:hypothetical protein